MNRYTLHDRKVHDHQTFGYRTGERWAVLDRETGKLVDEGTTRYEAQQAVNGWNAGVYDEVEEPPEESPTCTCGSGAATPSWHHSECPVRQNPAEQPSDEPRAAEEIHHDPEGRCEWYALCPNPADGTVKHPVLGDVPTCQRCADRFELPLVK